MKVSEKQRQEWTENPVTLALKELCEKERDDRPSLNDLLVFGNPQLTQENLLKNTWRELMWNTLIELLEGDWAEMELDDEE
ncbi:hypothetical protein LCGC14_1351430 [marine sediment metagenome]|uniref:Uncharacterized protein n=1 Tax=marine sediment metagenome TaxID=412755 RepID=A0A0F9ND35_9ZZZZ